MIQAENVIPLLQVFDMPASIEFYRDKLGFEVLQTGGEDWAMLRLGGAYLMLNTRYESGERPPAPHPAAAMVHEDTCLYFYCPNMEETYQFLVAKGVPTEQPKVAPYGMKQLYLKDPDGFALCFQYEAAKNYARS